MLCNQTFTVYNIEQELTPFLLIYFWYELMCYVIFLVSSVVILWYLDIEVDKSNFIIIVLKGLNYSPKRLNDWHPFPFLPN
jgi:hypothetical protein